MSLRVPNSQDNPESDHSSSRVNAQARGILLNLASTWTGSPILKPILQSAIDILDTVEDPNISRAQRAFLHRCIDAVKVLNGALQPDPKNTAPLLRRRIDNFKLLLTDIQEAVQANQSRAILSFLRFGRDGSLDRFEQRLLEAHGYFAITAEERLVTTDVNRHYDRPPAKPPPTHMQQDQQDHNRGGSQMFQSSRDLDFTGGTFYSAENVHIVRTEVTTSNVDITHNLSRIQTKLNHLLLFQSIVILF